MCEVISVAKRMRDARNIANTIVRQIHVNQFVIEADRPVHINLDGEPVYADQLGFSVLPAGFDVVY